jgi:hypothetical protein
VAQGLVVDLQPLQQGTGALPGFSPVQSGHLIYNDAGAADHDASTDSTLASDQESVSSEGTLQLSAIEPQALDRIDLSTVVDHELGNVAASQDLDTLANDVMSSVSGTGITRNASHVDAVLASL